MNYCKKIAAVLYCSLYVVCFAIAQTQPPVITLDYKNTSLSTVLASIEKQTGKSFFYEDNVINPKEKVSISVKGSDLQSIIETLFDKQITFSETEQHIVLQKIKSDDSENSTAAETTVSAAEGMATTQQPPSGIATRTVRGKILDELGEPLPNAVVQVKGNTKKYATTASDGTFEMSDVAPSTVFLVSYLGFKPVEYLVGSRSVVDIRLEPEAMKLDDVVVTGYQTISKERVTGSFAILSTEDINKQLSYNLASSIEGKVAGVVKEGNDLVIRGNSTFNAVKSPLYVIDGFPVEGESPKVTSTSAGSVLEYAPPSLNPEEIESITVLKDAAAASIYGARAANGVIVITTKRAKKGAPQVTATADVSIKPVYNFDRMGYMTANQFIDMQYDYVNRMPAASQANIIRDMRNGIPLTPTMEWLLQAKEGSISQADADRLIQQYRSNNNPYVADYANYIYRPVITQRYYLSVGKATDGSNTMGSITYNNSQKDYKNNLSNNLEINLNNSLNLTKWLGMDLLVNLKSANEEAPQLYNSLGGYMQQATSAPYTRLVDDSGKPIPLVVFNTRTQREALANYPNDLKNLDFILQDELDRNIQKNNTFRTRAAIKLNFAIAQWLKFSTSFQYENSSAKTELLYNAESYGMRLEYDNYSYLDASGKVQHLLPDGASLAVTNTNTANYTFRNQLNFNYTTDNKLHSIIALLGTETRQISAEQEYSRVWGYDPVTLTYLAVDNKSLGKPQSSIMGTSIGKSAGDFFRKLESQNRFVSFYANISYSFNNRFDATGSIRFDLSDMFGTSPKNQYRPMWSLGAGWNINKEEFMKDIRWINRLKLRATYGINGNVAKTVSPYLIASYGINPYTEQLAGAVVNPPNPNLRWEKTAVTNIGIDFDLFNSRLTGSLEYYYRNSTDLLSNASIDPAYGFSNQILNVGAMINQGVELELRGLLLKKRGFTWNAGLTFAYNYNEVTKLYFFPKEARDLYANAQLQEGYPYGSMYSYLFARINNKGETVLYDHEGKEKSLVNLTDLNDVSFDGSTTPLYSGAIQTSLAYLGFELSANFVYNAGHVMRKRISLPNMTYPQGVMVAGYGNSWAQPGDELNPGVTPRVTYGYDDNATYRDAHWRYNDSQVVSASYIKLRSLSLTYSLPKSLLKKTFLKNVALRAQADNLFFIAANGEGSDPEAYSLNMGSRLFPIMPTYSFGVNISF